MSVTVWYFADAAWMSGVFGLVGVLAGGLIAGFAARRAWVRDSRREF